MHQYKDYNADLFSHSLPIVGSVLSLLNRIKANREPLFYLLLQIIKELNRILTKSNSEDGIILNCSSNTALLQCVTSMSFTLRITSLSLFSCKSETCYFSTTIRSSVKKI